jgi:hypothetical protein
MTISVLYILKEAPGKMARTAGAPNTEAPSGRGGQTFQAPIKKNLVLNSAEVASGTLDFVLATSAIASVAKTNPRCQKTPLFSTVQKIYIQLSFFFA